MSTKNLSARVLYRLWKAELRTEVALEQQDYRIAWITVAKAAAGYSDPWRIAFNLVIGNSPEKAIPFWISAQDAAFDEYFPMSMLPLRYTKAWREEYQLGKRLAEQARTDLGLPPKKPSVSVPAECRTAVA